MATVKKAQYGDRITRRQENRLGRISEKNPDKAKEIAERMRLRATRKKRGRELYKSLAPKEDLPAFKARTMEEARDNKKAQGGKVKSFPDLNKDGKITKADILKGRGVIAKKGANIKKAQSGDTLVKKYPSVRMNTSKGYNTKETTYPGGDKETLRTKVSRSLKDHNMFKESYNEAKAKYKSRLNEEAKKSAVQSSKEVSGKRPAKIKKAQAGLKASNKRVGPIDPNGAWTKVQEMNLPPRNVKTKVSLTRDKQLGATKMMKMGGKAKAKKK